jgi:hypothetical protein
MHIKQKILVTDDTCVAVVYSQQSKLLARNVSGISFFFHVIFALLSYSQVPAKHLSLTPDTTTTTYYVRTYVDSRARARNDSRAQTDQSAKLQHARARNDDNNNLVCCCCCCWWCCGKKHAVFQFSTILLQSSYDHVTWNVYVLVSKNSENKNCVLCFV